VNETTVWVHGWHAVFGVLRYQPERVRRILLAANRQDRQQQECYERLANYPEIQPEIVPAAEFRGRFKAVHQGVAMLCVRSPEGGDRDLQALLAGDRQCNWLFVVLDRTQDPRNLGACLRTADAAGVHGVIIDRRRSAPLSPVAMKAASGAAGVVPLFRVANLVRTMQGLKRHGIWLFGADPLGGQELYDTELHGPCALVLGAEGTGLRRLVRETCDVLMRIPMHGVASSLNLSVATAICAYEAVRQRRLSAAGAATAESDKA